MRTTARQAMILLAQRWQSSVIGAAVICAVKGLEVDPVILKAELEKAGYTVRAEKLKVLTRVDVIDTTKLKALEAAELSKDDDDAMAQSIIASGTSSDADDALLQGVYGYLRELP